MFDFKNIGYIILSSIWFILFSCQESKEEIVELHDIIPVSEEYEEGTYDHEEVQKIENSIENPFSGFGGAIDLIENNLFPDRFGVLSSKKYNVYFDEDSLEFYQWTFKDSSTTMSVFYNWLDCFGKSCESIQMLEEKKWGNEAFKLMVKDTSLVYIRSEESFKQGVWDDYFLNDKEQQWYFILEQSRWGKVNWFTFANEEKTNLNNENSQ